MWGKKAAPYLIKTKQNKHLNIQMCVQVLNSRVLKNNRFYCPLRILLIDRNKNNYLFVTGRCLLFSFIVVSMTDQHRCNAFAALIRSYHNALYISQYFSSPLNDNMTVLLMA